MNATTLISIFDFVSFVTSLVSLVLAFVAIWYSVRSESAMNKYFDKVQAEMTKNFEKTQEYMKTQTEQSQKALSEVDKRAAVIEALVKDAQKELVGTVTAIATDKSDRSRIESQRQLTMQVAKLATGCSPSVGDGNAQPSAGAYGLPPAAQP